MILGGGGWLSELDSALLIVGSGITVGWTLGDGMTFGREILIFGVSLELIGNNEELLGANLIFTILDMFVDADFFNLNVPISFLLVVSDSKESSLCILVVEI